MFPKKPMVILFLAIFFLTSIPTTVLATTYQELVQNFYTYHQVINDLKSGKRGNVLDREHQIEQYTQFLNQTIEEIRKINPDSPLLPENTPEEESPGKWIETNGRTYEDLPDYKLYNSEALKQAEEKADYGEQFGASIITSLPNYLVDVIGLQDPTTLILNEPPYYKLAKIQKRLDNLAPYDLEYINLYAEKERLEEKINQMETGEKYLHTWNEGEFRAIALMYHTVDQFFPITLVGAFMILAFVFLGGALSGDEKKGAKLYFEGILIALLLIKFGDEIWKFVFDWNYRFVNIAKSSIHDRMGVSFLDMLYNPETRSLGNAIVGLVAATSIGVMNWQYTLRKIILGVLLITFPIMATAAIIPSKRVALTIWIREFTANVFLQAVHAFILAYFINHIYEAGSSSEAFWTSIIFVVSINMVGGLIRRILGAESVGSGIIGGVSGALGIGAIFAMSRMATGVVRGSSGKGSHNIKEALTESAEKAVHNTGNIASNTINNSSGFSNIIKPLTNFSSMSTGQQVKYSAAKGLQVASKATPYVTASIGMIGGSILGGAVMGNPGIGAAVLAMGGVKAGQTLVNHSDNLFSETILPGIKGTPDPLLNYGIEQADLNNMSKEEKSFLTNNLTQYQQSYTNMLEHAQKNIESISPKVEILKEQHIIAKDSGDKNLVEQAQADLNHGKAQMAQYKIQEIYAKDALKHSKTQEYIDCLRESYRKPPSGGGINDF